MGQDILKGYGMETQNRRITAQDMSSLPRYQSGGLIGKIKGIFSSGPEETVTQKYARQDAERAAKAAKAAPPAPTASAPAAPSSAIGSYAADASLKEREAKAMKAAGLKKGGAVRGPGTGTSDDVPIMASNGEFMIKASAVKKIGIEALEALNAIGDKGDSKAGKKDGMPAMKKGGAIRCMASGGFVGAKDSEEYNKAMQRDQSKTGFFSRAPSAPTPSDPSKTGYFSRNPSQPTQSLPATTPEEAQARAASIAQAYAAQGAPVPAFTQRQLAPGAIARLGATASPATPAPAVQAPTTTSPALPTQAPAMQAATTPAPGQVTRDGNSYSGTNVSGPVSFVDKAGGALPARGGFMSGTGDGSFKYGGGSDNGEALHAARMAAVERGDIESVRATYGGNFGGKTKADYATDPIQGAIRNLANGPMTAKRAAAMAQLQGGLGATIAGQGQADSSSAQAKLAQQKFGVDAKSAGIDQEVKSNMLAAQKVMADPNATPAQKAAAEENYRAWQGKYAKEATEQYAYAPGGQSVDPTTGQTVTQPGVIYNKATGEIKQQGGQKSIQTDPRATAIKNNAALSREQKITELKKIGYQ